MERSLAKNSLYNFLYKLLNVFFPLVSASYVARILSADGVGKVAGAQNIAQYFVAFAALGMSSYGTKQIAKASNRRETSQIFSELFFINAVSTGICVVLYYVLISVHPFFQGEYDLYLVAGSSIFLNFFNVDWFYQGKEEYKYIMLRSSLVKTLSLIVLLMFVRRKEDYVRYELIVCLAVAGNYLFNVFNLRKYTELCVRGLRIKRHFAPVLILLASSIAIDLYTMVDTTMLNVMRSSEEVGYYTNAVKIIRMISNCIIAMGSVMLPRISMYYAEGKEKELKETCHSVIRLLLFFSIPAAFGVWMIADNMVMVLFGEAFEGSVLTLRILSVLIMVFSIAGGCSATVLIATNREKQYLMTVVVGAVVNIAINSVLIPKIGHNGAAIASVCAEILVMMVQLFFIRRVFTGLLSWKNIYKSIIPTVVMILGIIAVKMIDTSDIVTLLLAIVGGTTVYFLSGWVVKNDQVMFAARKFLEKKSP